MPPRTGTARKVGLKRIDAPVDALRLMGFPEALVRRTVRKLLKAYGGDDGWTFIEECSYKLLIDSILEEQEKSERENSEPKLLGSSDPTLLVEYQVSEDGIVQDNSGTQDHSPQEKEEIGKLEKKCRNSQQSDWGSDRVSDLPKILEDTGQITHRRQRAENWTDSQKSDWVSDLPNHLKKTGQIAGQITLTAAVDSRGGKTAGNRILSFQKSKSNSITTKTIPRATKEFLT